MREIKEIIESLSPNERKILPFITLSLDEIINKTGLDKTSVLRAIHFLEQKKILKQNIKKTRVIDLDINGIYYKKNNFPERKLLILLENKNNINIEDAKKESQLSENEFKAAIGVLKEKSFIEISNGRIILKTVKEEITKKTPEEKFLESLPREEKSLSEDEHHTYELLKSRKNIIVVEEKKEIDLEITNVGRKIIETKIEDNLIEEITPEIIKNASRKINFRRYDLKTSVPHIHGGRRHFTSLIIEKARRIWLDMGFTEMEGRIIENSFWVFDALFTAQEHPVREMQDTFYLNNMYFEIDEKDILNRVRQAHEKGIEKSRGWNYQWSEEEAKRAILRTHTTSLSARALSKLKEKDLPVKFFAIGKVFRNETIDWSHGIEFYQTEGIVASKDVNFKHLLGYLKLFYKKMGFEKIRFKPSYFPYTEPSVEIEVFYPKKEKWLELGGAGMFRPEVTASIIGKNIPVLAWGQGLDRIIMNIYSIEDLRDIYSNNISDLRQRKLINVKEKFI